MLVIAFAVLFLSCQKNPVPRTNPQAKSPELFPEWAPRSRDANDAARFLAGLPGTPGSPFLDLEKQESWVEHQADLDSAWNPLMADWVPALHQFQNQELITARPGKRVAFYPFSGPDALTITLLFPDSPVYVMVGLEPPGTLPAPKDFSRQDLPSFLANVRGTVDSELRRSFFITREMDRQFRGQVSDGLFEPIVHLLVRLNNTILGYRYVRLDEAGRVIGRDPHDGVSGYLANNGIEIDFSTDTDRSIHRLFYFSANLADKSLNRNKPLIAFVGRLKGMTTFLKATSYMPHRPEFGAICRLVTENSSMILQDDSGIPYRLFDSAAWRIRLYGNYDRPYGSFRWLEQRDLKRAYETSHPKSLRFAIGYGFSRVPSNLLLATRTELAATEVSPVQGSRR